MQTTITNSVKIAADFIKSGEVAAFPTETVYGIGANAYDEKAVRKIFKAKGRPADNPLIVHITRKKDISVLAKEITPSAKKIIKEFFPGPVTVILKKNEIVPGVVTAGLDTIAIRMPASKIARELIKLSGVPIAAPSANLSGSPSPTNFIHVLRDMRNKIPCVLIGPAAKFGLESTVIDCTGKYPVILRPGSVTLEQIKRLDKNAVYQKRTGKVKSPGQKYKHYAPKARVKIVKRETSNVKRETSNVKRETSNVKREMSNVKRETSNVKRVKEAYIGLTRKFARDFEVAKICKTIEEYAKNLFSFFRECDELGIKTIYCEKVPEKGIGAAIMNRLGKARGKK
ncbi:MAG TPA: L-threonylcarbamoyladenylate synthase [Ignavibacteria bacterium]|nr:L-threonylcarbamoyladenylate synthase [Ignavibacteria bacterium]HRF65040.1 L-threonylcarbamoyladenylate synthase [Ignavibacteria bacterium]